MLDEQWSDPFDPVPDERTASNDILSPTQSVQIKMRRAGAPTMTVVVCAATDPLEIERRKAGL